MEIPSWRTRYILLQDGRFGENFWSRDLRDIPKQFAKGVLLQELRVIKQLRDSTRIAVNLIHCDIWSIPSFMQRELLQRAKRPFRFEFRREDVAPLTREEADLLLAIDSDTLRYQIYINRGRLDFGKRIQDGSHVMLCYVSKNLPGVVRYKGFLRGMRGTRFGVQLHEKYPGVCSCDGTYGDKRYFTCDPDSGVFVGLDKLMPMDDAEYKSPSKPLKRGEHGQANLESRPRDIAFPSFLKGKNDQSLQARTVDYLSTDQRVVTFLEDNDTPVRGTVRFIGEEKDASGRVLVGLELDEKIGSGSGKWNGRQLFVCKRDHATYVDIETVILERDFDNDPGEATTRPTSQKQDKQRTGSIKQEKRQNDGMFPRSSSYDLNETSGKEKANLERQLEVLQEEVEERNLRETSLIQQLNEKELQRENSQRQLQKIEEQIREKEDDKTNLERKLEVLQQEVEERNLRETSLIQQLNEKELQRENSQRQLQEIEEQIREKEDDKTNLERKLEVLQQEVEERNLRETSLIQQLNEKDLQRENSQRQLQEIEEQIREKEDDKTNLERQLEILQQQLREKEECLANYQAQVEEGNLRETSLMQQLEEKELQRENSQRQLQEIEEQIREKEGDKTNLERQLEILQQQLRERNLRETNFIQQLQETELQRENAQRQLQELEEQIREKEDDKANSERQLREMAQSFEERIRENEEEKTNLESQLGMKNQELSELETSLSAAQQMITELRRQESCDWVISRSEIQVLEDKCLGKGAWGSVNEARYCGCKVAVKQIHELILSDHNRRLFVREMNIASRCRHPCLLQFIGATNDEGSPFFVTELMELSLRALLEQRQLSETEISVITLDVCRALNYLHHMKPSPIVHRDVSSANVLLWRQGEQWRGKVSDYGTAKIVQQTMTAAPGAPMYSAPEAVSSNQTSKVDVYSFGVLLCEMCIGEMPDPERREEQVLLVRNRFFRNLVRQCLQADPAMRPDMAQIIQELEQFDGTDRLN